jgi:hypothetical protein
VRLDNQATNKEAQRPCSTFVMICKMGKSLPMDEANMRLRDNNCCCCCFAGFPTSQNLFFLFFRVGVRALNSLFVCRHFYS